MPAQLKVTDQDLPAMYRACNAQSLRAQGWYLRVHRAVLALLLLGAITSSAAGACAAAAPQLAIATAIFLLFGVVATASIRVTKQSNGWYDGRALAESAKSIAWKYMLRAAPYAGDDANSDRLLVHDLRKLLGDAMKGGISSIVAADGDQISPRMREVRALNMADRLGVYRGERLRDQRQWYATKAAAHDNFALGWVVAAVLAQAIACALSIAAAHWVGAVGWVGVFTTITSSTLTWTQLRRHEELAHSYAFTSHELGFVESRLPSLQTETDLAQFVSDCENAVSREHTMWRARRELAEPPSPV